MRPSLTGLLALVAGAILTTVSAQSPAPSHSWLTPLREDAARLIKAATADDFAWQRLAELTDTYGNRLSGSENLHARRGLGGPDDEGGRPRERAHGARDGAALGARQGSGGDRRSAATSDPDSGSGRHGAHAARRARGRSARGHQLRRPACRKAPTRRIASSSSTCRTTAIPRPSPTGMAAHAARLNTEPSRCWSDRSVRSVCGRRTPAA